MIVHRPAAGATLPVLFLAALLVMPTRLAAQGRAVRFEADSARAPSDGTTSERRTPGAEVGGLPVDSVEGALLLRPGITGSAEGISFRGGAPGEYTTYLDGINITPGTRRRRPALAPNMVGSATAVTGLDGKYLFDKLPDGKYTVCFDLKTLPSSFMDFQATRPNTGDDATPGRSAAR